MSQKRALPQEISPRKRVGSGDETRNNPTAPNTNSIIMHHMSTYLAAASAVSVARAGGSSVVQQLSEHCSRWCLVSSQSLLLLLLTDSGHLDLYYLGVEEHVLTMSSSWLAAFYVNV